MVFSRDLNAKENIKMAVRRGLTEEEANKEYRKWKEWYMHVGYREDGQRRQYNKKSPKAIFCVESNTIYSNAREAARNLGVRRDGIARCCRQSSGTYRGKHFRYVEAE